MPLISSAAVGAAISYRHRHRNAQVAPEPSVYTITNSQPNNVQADNYVAPKKFDYSDDVECCRCTLL